jgi:peroxiredoxin
MKDRQWVGCGIAIIFAVALFTGDGLAQGTGGRGAEEWPETGFLAPDFTLPDLSGTRVKLYREFRGRGLEIVAVSIDKKKADVARFVKTHAVTFPILLDPDFKVAQEYRVTGIPTHYFIDKKGFIRTREVGSKDWSKPETWKAIEGLF